MLKERLNKLYEALRRERVTFARYFVVGMSSFGVKFVAYYIQSRMVWKDGPPSVQNIIALIIAMIYNYTLHRYWTFRHQAPAAGSAQRYIFATLVWNSIDAGLFALLHEVFHIYDLLILVFNGGVIMCMSFVTHRLFTFHSNPWKRRPPVVQ